MGENMFGIQGVEWIIILGIIAVILFGSKKLPELARSIGRAKGEFERGRIEVERELRQERLSSSTGTEMEKLIKVAKELGIDTVGKTKDELKEEISKALSQQ